MCSRLQAIFLLICIIGMEVLIIQGIHIKIESKLLEENKIAKQASEIKKKIKKDIEAFPVALKYHNEVSFQNDFGASRDSGSHEGCDILYEKDTTGIVPIISATDGTVTNLGWLYLGGYRIGITSEQGIYYYYAHLDSYAPSLSVGKRVTAGEFLGFMGNTGEGDEGTKGKFPVHLHFGIYITDENGNEKSVNPYQYLLEIHDE